VSREEFIEYLEERKYNYKLTGDKIEVLGVDRIILRNVLDLQGVDYIPSGVVFSNKGGVKMLDLRDVPAGTEFNNNGPIYLGRSRDGGIKIDPSVIFNNRSSINIGYSGQSDKFAISTKEDYFSESDIDIDRIDKNMLFKLMVKQGVFK